MALVTTSTTGAPERSRTDEACTGEDRALVELARRDGAPLHVRFTSAHGLDVPLGTADRPSWRGRLHLIGLCLALPSVVLLLLATDTARARVGVSIYAAGLCSMLLVSTTYHRWVHELRLRFAWRRADHATIFAAIAGTATPVLLVVMPGSLGIALLAVIGVSSLVGVVCKLSRWPRGDAIGSVLYLAVGWMGAIVIPSLWRHGGVAAAVLWLCGGVLYSVGAVGFSKEWPRRVTSVFGYHEVWHLYTLAAAAAQFATIWLVAT